MPPEVRSAWRYVLRQPGFSLLAILSLAIAIGTNSAMFAVVRGFLLRSATDVDPARYVGVFAATRDAERRFRPFSYPEFELLRADRAVFADVSAAAYSQVSLTDAGQLRRIFAFLVSDNFFALAGARPAAGRFFTAAETAPGAAHPVVVVSHKLWQQLGARPDFVGRDLRINGRVCTVVGIAPPDFSGASPLLAPEVWLPLGFATETAAAFAASRAAADPFSPANHEFNLFARLRADLDRRTAQPLLPVLARRLDALDPDPRGVARELILARPFGIAPQPARESAFAPLTALTLGLSGLVLVVACLNLSNLQLARGSARVAEIATRLALGASRAQIVRQLLLEGLLLGLAGGALGVLLSAWAGVLLSQVLADRVADLGFLVVATFQPDRTVLLATLGACLLASLAFSLGPALRLSRRDLTHDLKSGSRGTLEGAGRSVWSGRSLLLIAQATLSFLLLFAAGVFLRSALASTEPPAGFTPAGHAVAELDFSLTPASDALHRRRAFDALASARRIPGVQSAGLATLIPYANDVQAARASLPPSDGSSAAPSPSVAALSAISEGYLDTLGARVLQGRDFTRAEAATPDTAPVCLIDETLAHRLFPTGSAVGRIISLRGGPDNRLHGDFVIVGLVSAHSQDVADRQRPMARVFVPLARLPHPTCFLVTRQATADTRTDATAVAALERTLKDTDPDLPVVSVKTLDTVLAANFGRWQARLGASLFGVFGIIAVALAAIGIYGVTAYAVARRVREIGVRTALGADRPAIFRLVLGRGTAQLAVACVLGGIASLGVGALLAGYVPDVRRLDPAVLALATSVLALASAPALLLPAFRATRIDPMIALRSE